jgi:hypothetical protein
MATPDPLAAEIAGIRDRASQITGDHDVAVCIADLGGPCSGHDAERLADVAEAVLAIHHDLGGRCARCFAAYGLREPWPCAEYKAITSKLLSKENNRG